MWFQEIFASSKQLFGIEKMSTLLLKIALPQILPNSLWYLWKNLPPVFSGEIFEFGGLWTAASEQSEMAACNVIRFVTIKISFGILL